MRIILAACLGLAGAAMAGERTPAVMKHVYVYKEPGRFAGWPANNGAGWIWGNEIVVGFARGWYKETTTGHSIDRTRKSESVLARSLDGGATWVLEDPEGYVGDGGQTVPSPGGIEFDHPDLAIRVGGESFFFSDDRARSWKGPYGFPGLDLKLTSRTAYLPVSRDECLFFLSADLPEVDGSNHNDRAFMASTKDGGKSFAFVSWLTGEPLKARSVMPATVRTAPERLVTITRRKIRDLETRKYVNWLEASVSEDNGDSWKFLSRVAETDRGEENGNPPALVRLNDGRLAVAYGYRSQPLGMRAKISRDHGATWSEEIILRRDGARWDLGYPRMVQRPDGRLVTMYYYNTKENPEQHIVATIWDPDSLTRE